MYSNHKDIDEEKSFEVNLDENVGKSTTQHVAFSEPHLVKRGLTEVSAMFDRNGKGYLDDTERALRRMDSQDKGFLGVDKVCVIFESLQSEQERSSELLEALRDESKKSMNLKKGVIALACFTLLLALANVGTSFAIATLVKDTEVSSNGDLAGTSDGSRVGTTSKLVSFDMQSLDETRRRRLQSSSTLLCEQMTETLADGATQKDCQLQGVMQIDTANALHAQLENVDFVQLKCNGKRSEIAGGTHLQGTPGVVNMGMDYEVFPGAVDFQGPGEPEAFDYDGRYQVIQNVRVPGVPGNPAQGILAVPSRFCDANFELAMYCPVDKVGGSHMDCLVMTNFLPTIECPTHPVICGPKPRTPSFIN